MDLLAYFYIFKKSEGYELFVVGPQTILKLKMGLHVGLVDLSKIALYESQISSFDNVAMDCPF